MNRFILILIAIGLLWNSFDTSQRALRTQKKSIISFDSKLSGELNKERKSEAQDGEREFYELDYLALNNITKKLLTLKVGTKPVDSPILLSFVSPVFTPPPNLS